MTPLDVVQLVLRILLAVALLVMGVNHFLPKPRRGMRAMIPPAMRRPGLPSPAFLVAFTGVCELAGAGGLLTPWPVLRLVTGIALAVFFVAVFPANAYAAAHRDRFGAVAVPFWPRLIAQGVLIAVVLFATIPF
ncbi:MAG: hypothetical protein HIU88_05025 [Acidobacteria bacterium]|nr:hypothetical protein [Acidobacteriota bacterium]